MPDALERFAVDCLSRLYMLFNRLAPLPTGQTAENVMALRTGQVNCYLLGHPGGWIAFDAGFSLPILRRELAKLAIDPASVTNLFLTHSDFDHAGGVPLFSNAEVFLSADELPLAEGRLRRKLFVRNRLDCESPRLLRDGEAVEIGDIRVKSITTPGHTPGSMSYMVEGVSDGSLLFTGDAFRILKGRAQPNHSFITMSPGESLRSIRKLAELEGIEAVFTGHRGMSRDYSSIMKAWK